MGILVKALIGALVVVLIGLLAKTRNYCRAPPPP